MYNTTYKVPGRSPEQSRDYISKIKKRIDPIFISNREGFIFKNEDTSEINTVLNNIRSNYSSIDIQHKKVNAEVEIRFGLFINKAGVERFEPGVSKREFERLKATLERLKFKKDEIINDVIYTGYSESKRKIVSNNVEKWEDKTRVGDWNIPLMNMRLSISDERQVDKMEMKSMPTLIRARARNTYYLPGAHAKIDLTTVQVIQKNNQDVTNQLIISYEVEVEMLQNNMNEFYKAIDFAYRNLYGTDLLYTVQEREAFIKYYHNLVTPPYYKTLPAQEKKKQSICYKFSGQERDSREVESSMLNKPQALTYGNLTYGNLVGNFKTIYRVGHKADGVRKLIVFKDKNIWLVSDPDEINLIYIGKVDIGIPNHTVLDGEILSNKNRIAIGIPAKKVMLIFDTLVFAGEQNVQTLSHTERLDKAKLISKAVLALFTNEGLESEANIELDENYLLHLYKFTRGDLIDFDVNRKVILKSKIHAPNTHKGAPILLLTKYFKAIPTPESFFTVMKHMLAIQGYTKDPTTSYQNKSYLSYDTDGLIFIPENTPYKFHKQHEKDKPHMHKNVAYLKQIKWKPVSKLTIDMTIVIRNNGIDILVLDDDTEVRFVGTDRNPLNYANVDFSHPLVDPNIKNLTSCTVYEFTWDGNKLYPSKFRPDKLYPNSLYVAQQTWDLIHSPITEEILMGNTMELVFKYHNREKRLLYDYVYRKNRDLTYLDLGAGNLGDLYKWNFKKVLAIEPYDKHVGEAKTRLSKTNLQDIVRILQARVQDTSLVYNNLIEWIGGPVDVIGSMFSMTFFWDSLDNLMKLIELIDLCLKPGGKFIFTVMNGDAIEQAYKPAFGGNWLGPTIDAGLYRIDWPDKNTNELKINIPGRSVNNQTEYLFRLDDLIYQLGKRGYTLDYTKSLTEEKLLTIQETIYTGFFMAGVFTKPYKQYIEQQIPPISTSIPISVPGLEGVAGFTSPLPSINNNSNIIPTTNIQNGLPDMKLPGIQGTIPSSPNIQVDIPAKIDQPFVVTNQANINQSNIVDYMVPGLDSIDSNVNQISQNNVLPGSPIINNNMPTNINPNINLNPSFTFPIAKPEAKMVSSIGPDDYQIIKVHNYPYTVLRLGAIGDGSCFIHAIMKACCAPYQEKTVDRNIFVSHYRAAVARWIVLSSYENPYKRNIELIAGGQLYNFLQETSTVELMEGSNMNFTVENLYKILNSCNYVGEEVNQIMSEVTGMDIIIVLMKTDGLHYISDTYINTRPKRRTIIIGGNGGHYETIALYTQGGIQTIFDFNHPLIETILANRFVKNFV